MNYMNNFINNWIFSYVNQKRLHNLFSHMISHINDCPLEPTLKYKKLEKMLKLYNNLNSLKNIPLTSHRLGIVWLDLCWKKVVFQNGFMDIDTTLYHTDYNDFKFEDNDNDDFTNIYTFDEYHKNNIVPINCQISRIENKLTGIKLCSVKPSLPELEGKLYGLCVEIYQPEFILRIFGIVNSDPMRIHRNKIPKHELFTDIENKYSITKEESMSYLNCISYWFIIIFN